MALPIRTRIAPQARGSTTWIIHPTALAARRIYYLQDDGGSNWLYDAAYAEGASTARKRPAPRTGNQAMHGIGYYNAQETSAVFEAGRTYTFSAWAQGDDDATASSSRAFLYIFDGSVPFSEANSLTFKRFAPDTGDFVNRGLGMTARKAKRIGGRSVFRTRLDRASPRLGTRWAWGSGWQATAEWMMPRLRR